MLLGSPVISSSPGESGIICDFCSGVLNESLRVPPNVTGNGQDATFPFF